MGEKERCEHRAVVPRGLETDLAVQGRPEVLAPAVFPGLVREAEYVGNRVSKGPLLPREAMGAVEASR